MYQISDSLCSYYKAAVPFVTFVSAGLPNQRKLSFIDKVYTILLKEVILDKHNGDKHITI